jgi:hypothetical protein
MLGALPGHIGKIAGHAGCKALDVCRKLWHCPLELVRNVGAAF